MIIDMWHGDSFASADKISVFFYPNDAEYRGNLYKNGKAIGDFTAKSSTEIEQRFNWLHFNWGR